MLKRNRVGSQRMRMTVQGIIMKKLLLGYVACIALLAAGTALAADMPVRAPVYKAPPPVAVYSWSGFYVGGNVGYSWGRANTDVGLPAEVFDAGTLAAFTASDVVRPKGVVGGVQIGWNVQAVNWVYGVEADWQASAEKASLSRSDPFSLAAGPIVSDTGATATQYEAKISWFGTLRGRLGYAADGLLFYGTGGLAYGRVGISGTTTVTATQCILAGGCTPPFVFDSSAFSGSKVNLGWTLGGGIEGALANNWSWKLEYLYLDLGSLDVSAATSTGLVVTAHTRFTDNIVRVGVNYRFGDPAVVARY
jgi:outer membrane immunogenic protein